MKYSKNRKYRDQEIVIEKEIVTLSKKIKKSSKSKIKKLNWFQKVVKWIKEF